MKRAAFPLAILAALATGFAARELVPTAQALTTPPANAVCAAFTEMGTNTLERQVSSWMNEQLASGRRNFMLAAGGQPIGCNTDPARSQEEAKFLLIRCITPASYCSW